MGGRRRGAGGRGQEEGRGRLGTVECSQRDRCVCEQCPLPSPFSPHRWHFFSRPRPRPSSLALALPLSPSPFLSRPRPSSLALRPSPLFSRPALFTDLGRRFNPGTLFGLGKLLGDGDLHLAVSLQVLRTAGHRHAAVPPSVPYGPVPCALFSSGPPRPFTFLHPTITHATLPGPSFMLVIAV